MPLTPLSLAPLALALACCAQAQADTAASALSEKDFMADIPIVLSVSRLAQRLDETPGAMTILDREFIRMSGARDVVDVLRFVPGFQTTTTFETDAPMASYHGRIDDFANRIQVMVDGRSVYSGYLQGSAGLGWQTLALEDIERIEILRGSNSASYGARAFLGVVNIVSRDVRDTLGTRAWVRGGENGVSDVGATVGWGQLTVQHRLSVDSRGDEGLRKLFISPDRLTRGNNRVDRFNYSGRFGNVTDGEIVVNAGALEIAAKRGTPDDAVYSEAGNIDRRRFLGSQYIQVGFGRSISENSDVALKFSRSQGFSNDAFPYLVPGPYYGTEVAFRAFEVNDVVDFQYTLRHSQNLRSVSGVEWRREWLSSRSSFESNGDVYTHFSRLFSSMEWNSRRGVVLNAGALVEDSDIAGRSVAPRLMVNWQPVLGHTLRAGYSHAFRTPSPFEKYGDVTYTPPSGATPLHFVRASGNVTSEKVESREIGYLFESSPAGLGVDLRLFNERIVGGIGRVLPGNGQPGNIPLGDFGNGDDYEMHGVEWQWQLQSIAGAKLYWTQSWMNSKVVSQAFPADGDAAKFRFKTEHGSPAYSQSLVWMQDLGEGYSLSLMHWSARDMALGGNNERLFSMTRNDLRFAREIRSPTSRVEAALTIQNLGAPYQDFSKDFWFDQRAFVSLRLEY